MRRPLRGIIIHCSASEWGTAIEIDKWHKARGWKGIGYHFVITNGYPTPSHARDKNRIELLDGAVEAGRPLDDDKWIENNEIGAHALGYNKDTIGICLIGNGRGNGKFTPSQMQSLFRLIKFLMRQFDLDIRWIHQNVIGHYAVNKHKSCPAFDVKVFINEVIKNINSHMLPIDSIKKILATQGKPREFYVK